MKKLILIPTIVMTGFLAFAFLRPATAAQVLGAFAPALNVAVPATVSAADRSGSTMPARAAGSRASGTGSSQGGTQGSSMALDQQASTGHSISTTSHDNCGRFGDGFHGGKHLFACPNRPFPAPVNHG